MEYDPHVLKLETPEECETFILNVKDKYPELVSQAKRRAVELRAAQTGAKDEIELEALRVIYAYEAVLFEKHNGRRVGARRTWGMMKKHGIVKGVERAVDRPVDPSGYKALVALGLEDLTFESLVLRHRDHFSADAVKRSEERLAHYKAAATESG